MVHLAFITTTTPLFARALLGSPSPPPVLRLLCRSSSRHVPGPRLLGRTKPPSPSPVVPASLRQRNPILPLRHPVEADLTAEVLKRLYKVLQAARNRRPRELQTRPPARPPHLPRHQGKPLLNPGRRQEPTVRSALLPDQVRAVPRPQSTVPRVIRHGWRPCTSPIHVYLQTNKLSRRMHDRCNRSSGRKRVNPPRHMIANLPHWPLPPTRLVLRIIIIIITIITTRSLRSLQRNRKNNRNYKWREAPGHFHRPRAPSRRDQALAQGTVPCPRYKNHLRQT